MADRSRGSASTGKHVRRPAAAGSKRLTTWQKASALVPLALLSGAWTTSMMAGPSATAASPHVSRLPDGTPIPSHPLKKPASVSAPGSIAPAAPQVAAQSVAGQSSPDGIPSVALAAYQNAARVIDKADPSCHLPWQLLAAIGRVESDHGRYGGNVLGSDGVARPGIYGIPLDGSAGTASIADTDSGKYDGDPVYDRAVGPMQFIPSTWSVVGVDADGDGVRNPQDINDAALGAAVYLCAGQEDLGTAAGRSAAVYRYNHNDDYVNLVLAIMRSYLAGDYTATANGTTAPVVLSPPVDATPKAGGRHRAGHRHETTTTSTGGKHRAGGKTSGGTTGGSTGGTGSTGGSGDSGSTPSTPVPTDVPTSTVTQATQPVVDTIGSTQQAVSFCTSHLPDLSSLSSADQQTVISDCASKIVGMTTDQAAKAIPDTLTGVLNWLGLTGILDSLLGGGGGILGGGTGGTGGTDGGGGGILGGVGGLLGGGS